MPTIRLELFRAKTLADGKHPVYVRVTHKGKQVRKAIGSATVAEYIGNPEKCLKGSSSAIRQLNIDIEDEYTKYAARFKELTRSAKDWQPEDVFAETTPTGNKIKTFWEISDIYLTYLTGYTKQSVTGKIKTFKEFVKNDDLLLSQIDSKLIADYVHGLRTIKQRNGCVNKENTIRSKIKAIRFVSNYGALHKFDTRPEDLHNFKLPNDQPAETEFLTEAELLAFANVDVASLNEAKHAFLLAVYLRGMRIGDIIQLKQSYFSNGRLKYTTGKTDKEMEMELVPKAQAIVDLYLDGREYLFHFYKFTYNPKLSAEANDKTKTDHVKSITANINMKLKRIAKRAGINKNVRTHIARHSFANILDSRNVDIAVIQALLGHSSRAMTEKYLKRVRQGAVLDQAVRDVFG